MNPSNVPDRRPDIQLKPSEITALRSRLQTLGIQSKIAAALQQRGRMLAAGLRRRDLLTVSVEVCRGLPKQSGD